MNTELDAYNRYDDAAFFLQRSDWFPINGSVWLPLHITLMIISQLLFPNSQLGPRLVTLLISALIPVLLYLLTLKLTGRKLISLLVAFIHIIYPVSLHMSTTTLTEPIFLVLILASQFFLLHRRYWLFSLGMFLSQATRFEAWFLIPWYLLIVWVLKDLGLKTKILISCVLICFPILYSGNSFIKNGAATTYFQEMAEMAADDQLIGVDNLPLAISEWNSKIWETTPMVLMLLIAVGIFAFHKSTTLIRKLTSTEQLIYVVTPIFLIFMLYVQVFLHLRDWLPSRYLYIPLTLAFPIMGAGLAWIIEIFSLRRFWLYYVLLGLVFSFEIYSLNLNVSRLISTYPQEYFSQTYTLLEKIKVLAGPTQIKNIFLAEDEATGLNSGFMRYFLMPQHPEIIYISLNRIDEIIRSEPKDSILIIRNNRETLSPIQLSALVTSGPYTAYQLFDQ